jgi:putative endonuclease
MKTMYVYILKCSDDSYYTGVTNNLENRIDQHNQGINVYCYTFTRRPLKLVFYEIFDGSAKAIAFEKKLKGWSRSKKEALINSDWESLVKFSKSKTFVNDPSTSSG